MLVSVYMTCTQVALRDQEYSAAPARAGDPAASRWGSAPDTEPTTVAAPLRPFDGGRGRSRRSPSRAPSWRRRGRAPSRTPRRVGELHTTVADPEEDAAHVVVRLPEPAW